MVEHPLFLAAVVAAFLVFGAVLAYADRVAGRRPTPDANPAE